MARELLNQVRVAAPCPASWRSMEGDDRVRFCSLCKLNVYNISEMTEGEAEDFIRKAEGRTCIRMYQRQDGTVLTRNCPVGIMSIYRRLGYAACLTLVLVFGGFSLAMAKVRSENPEEHGVDGLKERARNWPVIGKVIDHFDPPVQYTTGVIACPPGKP